MSDPTLQSLADEIRAIRNDLAAGMAARVRDINFLNEQFSGFTVPQISALESSVAAIAPLQAHVAGLRSSLAGNLSANRVSVDRLAMDFGDFAVIPRNALTQHARELRVIEGPGFDTVVVDGDLRVSGSVTAGFFQTSGGDCAEQFDIAWHASGEPGTLMVIGADGKLEPCTQGYDGRVAGVISGAGDLKTAVLLNERPGHRAAIALVGSVYCKCDAAYGAIAAGDLLTTSATTGHAMRADDANGKIGAIIGKALMPLAEGRGLIQMLVVPH